MPTATPRRLRRWRGGWPRAGSSRARTSSRARSPTSRTCSCACSPAPTPASSSSPCAEAPTRGRAPSRRMPCASGVLPGRACIRAGPHGLFPSMTVTTLRPRPRPRPRRQPGRQSRPAAVDLADLATPYVDLDVSVAVGNLRALRAALGGAMIHYAVRADPDPVLLQRLCASGASFDVASPAEVEAALGAGALASELVHGNQVARRSDLAAVHGSSVLCLLVTSGEASSWPLARAYGCASSQAVAVLRRAAALGLRPEGVSLVGSPDGESVSWAAQFGVAATVFARLRDVGLAPSVVDIGAGPSADLGAGAVDAALATCFPDARPRLIARSGPDIVADTRAVVSTVLAVSWRGDIRWVHLDAAPGAGLPVPAGAPGRCRIETSAAGGPTGPAVLAGPALDAPDGDPADGRAVPASLPLALGDGDIVRLAGPHALTAPTAGLRDVAPVIPLVAG